MKLLILYLLKYVYVTISNLCIDAIVFVLSIFRYSFCKINNFTVIAIVIVIVIVKRHSFKKLSLNVEI